MAIPTYQYSVRFVAEPKYLGSYKTTSGLEFVARLTQEPKQGAQDVSRFFFGGGGCFVRWREHDLHKQDEMPIPTSTGTITPLQLYLVQGPDVILPSHLLPSHSYFVTPSPYALTVGCLLLQGLAAGYLSHDALILTSITTL